VRVLLFLLLLTVPAWAEDRPLLTPSRDVDIIYRVPGPDGPLEQRLRWGVAEGKLRVDPPSPGLFMVFDMRRHLLDTVREVDHTVLEVETTATGMPGAASGGVFIRRGAAEVAGLACTQWATIDNGGKPALVCLTDDGVLLRAAGDGRVLALATEVRYAPLDAAVFRIPSDYQRISPPRVKR
jgi:hypothetical protein